MPQQVGCCHTSSEITVPQQCVQSVTLGDCWSEATVPPKCVPTMISVPDSA